MKTSFQNDFKAIRILYAAMLAGQVIFGGIAVVIVHTAHFSPRNAVTVHDFLIMAPIFSLSSVGFSYPLFRKKLKEARELNDLASKLSGYRAALILQMALCEAPALFCIIGYMLTVNPWLLLLLGLLLLNFANLYPSKDKLVRQLELNEAEASLFDE